MSDNNFKKTFGYKKMLKLVYDSIDKRYNYIIGPDMFSYSTSN